MARRGEEGATAEGFGPKLLGRFDARFVRGCSCWKVHLAQASKRNRVDGARRGQDARSVVSAAFEGWRGFIVHHARNSGEGSGGAVGEVRRRATARGRSKWASTVAERAVVRASLARPLARFANCAPLPRRSPTWTDSVTEARRLRSRWLESRRGFPIRHCPQRGSGGQSSCGRSARWRTRWTPRRSQDAKPSHRVGVPTWIDAVAESERLKAVLRRVAGKFANRRLAASWETWVDAVAESERLRALASQSRG